MEKLLRFSGAVEVIFRCNRPRGLQLFALKNASNWQLIPTSKPSTFSIMSCK